MSRLQTFFDRPRPRWLRKLLVSGRRANFIQTLEIGAGIALAIMLGLAVVSILDAAEQDTLMPSGRAAALLIGTLVPAMALLVLLGRRLALRRAAHSTARMHVRIVFFFSLVAAVPTLLVVIFAASLFRSGIEFWFSDNSRGMLENANKLARGYYEQNLRDVGNETVTMAGDLRSYLAQTSILSPDFAEGYSYQVVGRKLNESSILQKGEDGLLRTAAIVDPDEGDSRKRISRETLRKIDAGQTVVVTASANRIEAFTAIDRRAGIYLYAARSSDALALSQWERAQSVRRAYAILTSRARTLQLRFHLALFFASLALVSFAVWFALRFADRQVQPLTDLVGAARRVGSGDFGQRVAGRTGADEIGMLNRAFNRMTSQIEQQTTALVLANRQMEERRSFIEAVLESLSAGIVSVDREGTILLMNSSAQNLMLGIAGETPVGLALIDVAPQLWSMVGAGEGAGIVQHGKDGELLTLAVKVAPAAAGYVITFEDITRQILNQRQAAWSDVARRIAHEIKNPLTPIQLATERLKRRYRKQIELDGELFDDLTNTIIRQVGDLRRMVDEFSSFARLPKPVFRNEDAVDLVRQAVFLQEVAKPEIYYTISAQDDLASTIACDRHQFAQVMTNLLKNAAEAIETRTQEEQSESRGRISVEMGATDEHFVVCITDNGIGLPVDRDRIIEPYVTTREKGTGLGLAIVNKIVEEHGGDMSFANAPGGGTTVTVRFARNPDSIEEAAA